MSGCALAIAVTNTTTHPVVLWSLPGPHIPAAPFLHNAGWYADGAGDFSPDGSILAIGSTLYPYLILYHTADWSEISGPTLSGATHCLALSDTQLAVGGADGLSVFNLSDWTAVSGTPTFGSTDVLDVAYSPNGDYLAIASVENASNPTVRVYRTDTWVSVTIPGAPTGTATSVSWSADGSQLAATLTDSPGVKAFRADTWAAITTPTFSSATAVAYSPASGKVAVGGAGLSIFALADWSAVATPAVENVAALAFSADGSQLVVGDTAGMVRLLAAADWSEDVAQSVGAPVRGLAVSAAARAKTVSGVISDANGNPCARSCHLLRRGDLALLDSTVSSAVDGTYRLSSFFASGVECVRLALDTTGDYNDRVQRVTPG